MSDEVSADDCIHGLPAFTCSICLGRPLRDVRAESRPFLARFPGRCVGCGGRIEEGEEIVRSGEGYSHVDCI